MQSVTFTAKTIYTGGKKPQCQKVGSCNVLMLRNIEIPRADPFKNLSVCNEWIILPPHWS